MISLEKIIVNIDNDDIPSFDLQSSESITDNFEEIRKIYNEIYFNYSKSTEGVISLISKGIAFILKIIATIIKFISKCIVMISEFIVNKIARFIVFLTSDKKPNKEKSDKYIVKLKNTELSRENKDNDKENLVEFVKYIQNYIKKPDEIEKMSKEELIFYKTFLINGNPQNIRMICDIFNKETSKLKNNGIQINKIGMKLLVNNTFNSHESYNYSTENENNNENIEYEPLGKELINSVKVDNSTNVKKDYISVINNMYATLYSNNSDSTWLNRIKNIFTNGSNELKTIMVDLKKKQEFFEKIKNNNNLNESFKNNLNKYTKVIQSFQPSIYSYINCANYFNKYQSIRMNIVNKFCNLVNKSA